MKGKTKKILYTIDMHARKSCYHLKGFKWGKAECKFCKKFRMPGKICDEIAKRPRFLPLSEPIDTKIWEKNRDALKYKSFN